MTEKELAIKYVPHMYFDQNEPFLVDRIGYSILSETQKSPSFDRVIWIDREHVAFVIEYAIYYDYDIQHMYDLEHVWVYVGHDGKVWDGEASAHGHHFNCYQYTKRIEDETHITVYVQPGKHAMLPDGSLCMLFSDVKKVCNVWAGVDGILVKEMFQDRIIKSSYYDYLVNRHIRKHYSFDPSLTFYRYDYDESIIITWDELFDLIPVRLNSLLEQIVNEEK